MALKSLNYALGGGRFYMKILGQIWNVLGQIKNSLG